MGEEMTLLRQIRSLKIGDEVKVYYWDHYATNEEEDDGPVLAGARGYFVKIIRHAKQPALKLSMHDDYSFPFMAILITSIDRIEKVAA